MLAYKRLFDALAAGDFQLATGLAQVMGGRPKIEREHDHPFDRAMGYALKAQVLMADVQAAPVGARTCSGQARERRLSWVWCRF